MPVYDDEKQDISYKPGDHDDLGVHPERREAEIDSLEKAYNSGESSADLKDAEESGESGDSETDYAEEAGLYRDDDEQIGRFKRAGLAFSGMSNNRKALVGGGVIGLFLVGGGIFSFLNVFRLDHVFNNVDSKAFARINATFDDRSGDWIKAYFKLRMTELNGDVAPGQDTLFFRANQVDNNNPLTDWYRTMRTSKFEQELFDRHGIAFTGAEVTGPDGNKTFKLGKVTIRDVPVDANFSDQITSLDLADSRGASDMLNKIGPDLNRFVDVQLFEGKEARRVIKGAVNDNTKPWQVFKRRHMRKDIQNMTGIGKWKFFEKTRDKIDNRKVAIQRKIINATFTSNSNSSKLLKCILGAAKCPVTTDPSDPENKAKGVHTGTSPAEGDQGDGSDSNGDGKITPDEQNISRSAEELAEIEKIQKGAGQKAVNETVEEVINISPIQKMVIDLTTSITGGGIAKAWTWAKRLAAIHNMFTRDNGQDSKIEKIVNNARLAQLVAVYATYQISRDQIHSGELVGDELNNFTGTMQNFGNSEGWSRISNSGKSGSVSAAVATDPSKEEYCKAGHKKSFEQNEYAWMCDGQKPNGGSNAASLTDAYNNTVGYIIGPIADAVNAIRNAPIVGAITDWLNSVVEDLFAKTIEPIITGLLEATGADKTIQGALAAAMTKLLEFLGVGPAFDGSTPGVANLLVAGAAGSAEGTTRGSGGIASTAQSLAYSNQLAANFQRETHENQSLFTRYASLNNYESLASTTLFNVSDSNVASSFARFSNIPKTFSSIFGTFSKSVFAQSKDESASATAEWAGVNTYDIPQICLDLDPMSPDYLLNGTNAQDIGVNVTWGIVRDTDKFWEAVYAKARAMDPENPESITGKIFNCHLLDARVAGGLGFVNGYDKDNGYTGQGVGTATSTTPNNDVADLDKDSSAIPCAPGTTDLGSPAGYEGYYGGEMVKIRLCAIPGFKSNLGGEYVPGDNGDVVVNSRVSKNYLNLFNDAKGQGVNFTSYGAGFRTMAQQTQICSGNSQCVNGDYSAVARPGYSFHQIGAAVDFNLGDGLGTEVDSYGAADGGSVSKVNPRVGTTASWEWLKTNASKYGLVQYWNEPWHWSPVNAATSGAGF